MKTFADLIDAFGIRTLSETLGVKESHVRVMKARGSIPPEHWSALVGRASELNIEGVTHEALLAARKERRAGSMAEAS